MEIRWKRTKHVGRFPYRGLGALAAEDEDRGAFSVVAGVGLSGSSDDKARGVVSGDV